MEMNETPKTAIQHNWEFLLKNVDVDNSLLLDYLYEMCVLTKHQKDEVSNAPTDKERVSALLEILQHKGVVTFQEFLEALDKSHQRNVADKLRHAFQDHHPPDHTPHIDTNK